MENTNSNMASQVGDEQYIDTATDIATRISSLEAQNENLSKSVEYILNSIHSFEAESQQMQQQVEQPIEANVGVTSDAAKLYEQYQQQQIQQQQMQNPQAL